MSLKDKSCIPCKGGIPPISYDEENKLIKKLEGWQLIRNGIHKISKDFTFKNFKKSMSFVNKVAQVAEEQGHHPNIEIRYNKVHLELYTHAIKGLHENDFILAAKIDSI